MPTTCCVCRRSFDIYYNLSFHRFPSTGEKKTLWCAAMGLSCDNVKAHWKICGLHFTADSFRDPAVGSRKRWLRPDAVPVIIHISEEEITKNAQLMIRGVDDEISINALESENQQHRSEVDVATDSINDTEHIAIIEDRTCDKTMVKKKASGSMDDTSANIKSKKMKIIKRGDVGVLSDGSKIIRKSKDETIADLRRKLTRERGRCTRLRKTLKSFRSLMKGSKMEKMLPDATTDELLVT